MLVKRGKLTEAMNELFTTIVAGGLFGKGGIITKEVIETLLKKPTKMPHTPTRAEEAKIQESSAVPRKPGTAGERVAAITKGYNLNLADQSVNGATLTGGDPGAVAGSGQTFNIILKVDGKTLSDVLMPHSPMTAVAPSGYA